LLTLLGPGGIGKTRLAVRVAAGCEATFPDGVWFVELATETEPALVLSAVARALNIDERRHRAPLATLVEGLGASRVLLVLDNCEHLLAACADLATSLLRACPNLTILATSREPLGVPGEVRYAVSGLASPPPTAAAHEVLGAEAVRLFAERAQAAKAGFELDDHMVPDVAELCRRLDGIPLAIELAAARVGVLSPAEILDNLDDRMTLLDGSVRTVPARHRTLAAAIGWSETLLAHDERRLFHRLGVFGGGFTLEAAEAVCAGDGIQHSAVLRLLERVLDASLLLANADANTATRYRLLEPIRTYARAALDSEPDGRATAARHSAFYTALAESAESELRGPHHDACVRRLEQEHDNLRLAMRRALSDSDPECGLRIAAALWRFWAETGHLSEGYAWHESLLNHSGSRAPERLPRRARAVVSAGNLAWRKGEFAPARVWFEEAVEVCRSIADRRGLADALHGLGTIAYEQEDYEPAVELLERSLALRRSTGDRFGAAVSLNNLGEIARDRGQIEVAAELHAASMALKKELGDIRGVARSMLNLAEVARDRTDYAEAAVLYLQSMELLRPTSNWLLLAECLEGVAAIAALSRRAERAARLGAVAAALRERFGTPLPPVDRGRWRRTEERIRGLLGEVGYAIARAAGNSMTPDRAVEEAVSECHEPHQARPPRERPGGLSVREQEVLRHVAAGHTNQEIAGALIVSRATVDRHLANLYAKLGVRNRAEATIWALTQAALTAG
jgi:non-specific serine/threonine protein kinase